MLFFSRDLSVDEKNVYMEALAFILNVGKSNNDAKKEYMETQMAEIGLSKKDFRSAKKVKTAGELAKDIKGIGDIKVKRFILREMILLALALAAVCGFGWYGYTACDRVSFFDARLQAYYQQAENGANGWVLETRAEDVYLKPTHADWHYEAIRYRIPWVHDTLDKLLKKDTDLLRSTGWMRTDHSAVVDAADMTAAFNGQDGTWYAVGSEPAAWDEVEWPE